MIKFKKLIIISALTLVISNGSQIKQAVIESEDVESDVITDADVVDGENGFEVLNAPAQNSADSLISYDYISAISGSYDPIAMSNHQKVYFSGYNSSTKSGSGISGGVYKFTEYSNWNRSDGTPIKAVGNSNSSFVLYDNGVVMSAGAATRAGFGAEQTTARYLTNAADDIWMTFGDAAFIRKGDRIWGVGNGSTGRIVVGQTSNQDYLVEITSQFNNAGVDVEDIVDIQGSGTTVVQMKDGTLYGFGTTNGVMGVSSSSVLSSVTNISNRIPYTASPVKKIVATTSLMVLFEDGTVYGAGSNNYGMLGQGHRSTIHGSYQKLNTPTLEEGDKIIEMFSSPSESYLLTKFGRIFGSGGYWSGTSGFNSLCIGMTNYITSFTEITSYFPEWGRNIKMINPVTNRTLFLTHEGYLFGCGYDNTGRLATGNTSATTYTGTRKVVSVAFHSATVTANSINFSFNILSEGYYAPTWRYLRIKNADTNSFVSTTSYSASQQNIDHTINRTSGISADTNYEVYVDDSNGYGFIGGIKFKTEKTAPTATIGNVNVTFNEITADITLIDSAQSIDNTFGEPRVELIDTYGIVRGTKDLLTGINSVQFGNLKLNSEYTIRIFATFDTGKGLVQDSLLESLDVTSGNKIKPSAVISSSNILQTTISGELDLSDVEHSIISMQLYIEDSNGNNVPGKTITYKEQLNGSTIVSFEFKDVVVGQGYNLVLEISYNIDGNLVIGEEQDRVVFTIVEADKPQAELEVQNVNVSALEIEVRLLDKDSTISDKESSFVQLFEIWDINGVDTEVETYLIMNIDAKLTQPDFTTPGELYTLNGLSPNMKYIAKIYTTYDVGYGLTRNELLYTSTEFETNYYAAPSVTIDNIAVNKERLSFDIDIEDIDNIIESGKVIVTDESNIALEEDIKIGKTSYDAINLLSNKNYYIIVEITYDRGDGLETATEIKDSKTLLKEEHTLDILETEILWNEIEIELDIVDNDNVIKDDGIVIRASYVSASGDVEVGEITKDPLDILSGIRFVSLEANVEYIFDIIIEYDTGLEIEEIKEYSKTITTIRKVQTAGTIDVTSVASVGVQDIEFNVTIDDVDGAIVFNGLEYQHVEVVVYDELGDEVTAKRVILTIGSSTCIGSQCIFSNIVINDLQANKLYSLELEILEDIGDGEVLEIKDVKSGQTAVRDEETVTVVGLTENIINGNGIIEIQFEVEDIGNAIISDIDVTITKEGQDESIIQSFTMSSPTEIFTVTYDTEYETLAGEKVLIKPGREYEVVVRYTKDIYDDGIGQEEVVSQKINLREKSEPIAAIQVTNIGITTVEFETRIIDTDISILSQMLVVVTENNERTEVSVALGVESHKLENYVNMQPKEKYKISIELEFDRGREIAVGDYLETKVVEQEVETLEKDAPEGSITAVDVDYVTEIMEIEGEVIDIDDSLTKDTKINVIVKDSNNIELFSEEIDGLMINISKSVDMVPNVEYRIYIEATYNTGNGIITEDIYNEFGNSEDYYRYISPRKLPVDAEFLSINVNINVIEFEISIIDVENSLAQKAFVEIREESSLTPDKVLEIDTGSTKIEVAMLPNKIYEVELYGIFNIGDGESQGILKRMSDGKEAYEKVRTEMYALPNSQLEIVEEKFDLVKVDIELTEVGKGLIQDRVVRLTDLSGVVIEEYDLIENHLGSIQFSKVEINTNYFVQLIVLVDIGEGKREYILQSEEARVGQKQDIRFTSERQIIGKEDATFKWDKEDEDNAIISVIVTLDEVVTGSDNIEGIYTEDITQDVLLNHEGTVLFTGLELGKNYIVRYAVEFERGDSVPLNHPINSIEFRTSYRLPPVSQIKVQTVEWNLIELDIVINDSDIAIIGDITLSIYDEQDVLMEERIIEGSGTQRFEDLEESNLYKIDLFYEYEIGDGEDYNKRDVIGLKTNIDLVGLGGKVGIGAGSLLVAYIIFKKFKKIDTSL